MKRRTAYAFGLSLLLTSLGALAVPATVGLVDFAKGKVSAQHPNMGSRGLATKASIYGQDLVETGDQSFSVLRFKDNNKVTVRPLSRFSVSGQGSNVHLDQGSLNVESGAARMNINTKDAKVEAQNAKLEVRVCQQDCTVTAKDTKVVAKVVNKTGQVRAGNRALAEGSALYESDRLISGPNGQLLAVFTDGGRISLGPDTEISIKEYRYGKTNKDRSTLQLIKGSLRSVTGQIGKSVPENYSIQTPVATMGVRGTSFDLVYPVNAKGQRGKGLLAQVREGVITQRNAAGSFALSAGKVSFIGGQDQAPTTLAAMPAASQQALGQKPEEAHANLQQLFGTQGTANLSSGTYVHVEAGQVTFISESGTDKGKRLTLGKGQSAFVDENGNMQLLSVPIQDKPGTAGSALAAGAQSEDDDGLAGIPGLDDKSAIADKTADKIEEAVGQVQNVTTVKIGGVATGISVDGSSFDDELEMIGTDFHGTQGTIQGQPVNLVHYPSNFSYMSWGEWNGNIQAYSHPYTDGNFITGSYTLPDNMPKSGTAYYHGDVHGDYTSSGTLYHNLEGDVNLMADFGNQTISGNFNFRAGGSPLANATMPPTSIEGSGFHGQLSPETGTVHGHFYGPVANEVGGSVWYQYGGPGGDKIEGIWGATQ